MTLTLPAITRIWVADRFIAYFGEKHHKDRTFFGLDPDLKAAFNYNKAAWRQLADEFNLWKWMSDRGMAIAQPEMDENLTISALTELVISKIH
jgi:hypothetical protein